jgi:hypothetical protein
LLHGLLNSKERQVKLTDLPAIPPKGLFYGAVGSGKTALVTTLGKILEVIDLNNGLRTCLTLADQFTEQRKAIEVHQILDSRPNETKFGTLKVKLMDVANRCQAKTYPYLALAIDGLTDMYQMAMRYVLVNSGKGDPMNGAPSKAVEIQHFGMAFNEITQIMVMLKSLPIAVFMIAHDQKDFVGEGADRKMFTEIGIQGKNMPALVASFFDEVWYTKTEIGAGNRISYKIQTMQSPLIIARTRYNIRDNTDQNLGLRAILASAGYRFPDELKEVPSGTTK